MGLSIHSLLSAADGLRAPHSAQSALSVGGISLSMWCHLTCQCTTVLRLPFGV